MVEPIRSQEIFGKATAVQGERPTHTEPDHRQCAYYKRGDDPDELICEHGEVAFGAWYNEDFIWALRTTSHNLITRLLTMNLSPDQFRQIRNDLHQLELLTK